MTRLLDGLSSSMPLGCKHESFTGTERETSKRKGWKGNILLCTKFARANDPPHSGKLTTNVTSFKDSRESTNLWTGRIGKILGIFDRGEMSFSATARTKTFIETKINFRSSKDPQIAT